MKLIGEGETAEVFDYSERKVLKLYRKDYEDEMENEKKFTELISEKFGLAPKVFGTVNHEGRTGLIMEKVDGRLMMDIIRDDAVSMLKYAQILGKEHKKMHSIKTDDEIVRIKPFLRRGVQRASFLNGKELEDVLFMYDSIPEGDCLNHGDFMPYNIIMSDTEFKVLDWNDCGIGNPLADVARTVNFILDTTDSVDAPFAESREEFAREYLKSYFYPEEIDYENLGKWLIINGILEINYAEYFGNTDEYSERLKRFVIENHKNIKEPKALIPK